MMFIQAKNRFVISFSFGNYLKADGGVDKLIAEQQKIFNSHGVSYIQIAPVKYKANHFKRVDRTNDFFSLVIDGIFCGIVTEKELDYILGIYTVSSSKLCGVFINHFSKFNLSVIDKFIGKTNYCPIYVYLHDYYMVCVQLNLLRNDETFCGKNEKNLNDCEGCLYSESVQEHQKELANLLSKYQDRVVIVAPSQTTLDIWNNSYEKYVPSIKKMIIPHMALEGLNYAKPLVKDKLKIAFLGRFIDQKGKNAFEELVSLYSSRYDFYYLGMSENVAVGKVKNVYVKVDKENPDAMRNALQDNGINIALLWSLSPETYSYTYFEAYSKNVFVITNNNSGNIADATYINKNGKVLNSINDLMNYCSSDSLIRDYEDFYQSNNYGPLIMRPNEEVYQLTNNYEDEYNSKVKVKPRRMPIEGMIELLYKAKNKL